MGSHMAPKILLALPALVAISHAKDVIIGTSEGYFPYWNAIPSSPEKYTVDVGDTLIFKYNTQHNVWLMDSNQNYKKCNFGNSVELASKSYGGGTDQANEFSYVVEAPGTYYFG